ncbi:hypothetical protein AB0M54_34800 [Actinoplanes sp. NPDC051470]|uniref:hypothetical protein n=1 Tax=unclassified Actinoplanes TaxID=2626549 RepID=UPI003448D16C
MKSLLADAPSIEPAPERDPGAVLDHLVRRGVRYTTWAGWQRLDAHEIALGVPHDRKRIKVVDRQELIDICAS